MHKADLAALGSWHRLDSPLAPLLLSPNANGIRPGHQLHFLRGHAQLDRHVPIGARHILPRGRRQHVPARSHLHLLLNLHVGLSSMALL